MSGLALRALLEHGSGETGARRLWLSRAPIEMRTWPIWAVSALVAAAALGIVTTIRELPAFEPEPTVPWWFVALLFAAAEAIAFHVQVRGHVAAVALRGTPLLLGLFVLPPIHLVAAHVVGATLALSVRRPPSAAAAVLMLAVAAFGTAAAAAAFRVLAAVAPTSPLEWWGAASAAALIVAAASIVSRPSVRSLSALHITRHALVAALVPTCGLAVVDASLGMIVVVHARTDPAELWLLAGPTVIAVLAYRAYESLRRRQASLEFLHQRTLALVQDLDQANTALQQASDTRSRLLASVSHELRTPLHSILLAAQLVRDSGLEQGGNRRVRGLGETIEGSGRHLLGLIDDFVDLSRIEVGAFELRPASVFLGQLLNDVRRDMAPLAAEKGISVTIEEVRGVRLVADPLRLRQVLLNLLSNAVKFTQRGGRVRLSVRFQADSLRISVEDTGIGIAPEDLERAFLPFEQVSGTDAPGVGLGLAISRRIAELHGGTLTAESAVGRGSTFTVTLPDAERVSEADARPDRKPLAMVPAPIGGALDADERVADAERPIVVFQHAGPQAASGSSLAATG